MHTAAMAAHSVFTTDSTYRKKRTDPWDVTNFFNLKDKPKPSLGTGPKSDTAATAAAAVHQAVVLLDNWASAAVVGPDALHALLNNLQFLDVLPLAHDPMPSSPNADHDH
ncbi:MAG: hypothetical protein LBG09_01245 [Puniceicoccales bacterium]|nr:hypothetical protein [Puniceicoccales bacterium]